MKMAEIFAIAVSLLLASWAAGGDKTAGPPGPPPGPAWDEAASAPQSAPASALPPGLPPGVPVAPPAPHPPCGPGFGPPGGPGGRAMPDAPPPICPGMLPGGPPGVLAPGHHWDPILHLLMERRPSLAERLARLREHDPERFEQVLADALGARLERALDEQDAERPVGEGSDVARRPERPGPPDWVGGPPHHGKEGRFRDLQEQQAKFERQSRELAVQLLRLQRQSASPDELQRARVELAQVINQQFDLRTELRKGELEWLEGELNRVQERIEHARQELERRQTERDEIVARRLQQLTTEDDAGW